MPEFMLWSLGIFAAVMLLAVFAAFVPVRVHETPKPDEAVYTAGEPIAIDGPHEILVDDIAPNGERIIVVRTDAGDAAIYTSYQPDRATIQTFRGLLRPKGPAVVDLGGSGYYTPNGGWIKPLALILVDNPDNIEDPAHLKLSWTGEWRSA